MNSLNRGKHRNNFTKTFQYLDKDLDKMYDQTKHWHRTQTCEGNGGQVRKSASRKNTQGKEKNLNEWSYLSK